MGDQGGAVSDATGAFDYRYEVSGDHPLGTSEVTVAATDLNISASVQFEVRSAPNMIVTPVEALRPGELAMLHVTLLDDRWEGIPRATLRMNDDVVVVTNGVGESLVEIMPPETEEVLTLPFTFTFDGDDQQMPVTYFIGIPVTPHGFNWLLWVGAPGVVAALAVAGYAGRRLNVVPAPPLGRRRGAVEVATSPADSGDDTLELAEEAPVETRTEVTLEITFTKPAEDLPDVWGVGELVGITVRAVDSQGDALAGVELAVTVTGEDAAMLVTDDDGACALHSTADDVGEYTISVRSQGMRTTCRPPSLEELPRRRIPGGDCPPVQRLP